MKETGIDEELLSYAISPDDYELDKKLGEGTFAIVFRARNTKKQEIVALKRFKDSFEDEKTKNMFMREVKMMFNMKHPCILGLQGFYIPPPLSYFNPFIVMDYMPNGDLFTMLLKEMRGKHPPKWTPTAKLKVAFGVAVGMAHIHKHFGIHRDLKPANILLDENFEPKISDFGLAKIHDSANTMSIIAGSPYWMAPELFKEEKYDQKVDVYAYGVLLYQLLTGLLPFECKLSRAKLCMMITNGERPEIPDTLDEYYADIIRRCWDQTPSNRPTFDEVYRLLKNAPTFLEGTDVEELRNYQNRTLQEHRATNTNHFEAALSYLQVQYYDLAANELRLVKDKATLKLIFEHALLILDSNCNEFERKAGMLMMKIAAENGNKKAEKFIQDDFENQFREQCENQNIPQTNARKRFYRKANIHELEIKRKSIGIRIPPILIPPIYESQSQPSTPLEALSPLRNTNSEKMESEQTFQQTRRHTYDGNNNCEFSSNKETDTFPNDMQKLYERGMQLLCENKTNEAARLLKHASQLGHADANYQCGLLLLYGKCVKRDPNKAAFFFKAAADKNHGLAMLECSRLLSQGNGVRRDIQKALEYCRNAIKVGIVEAKKEYNELLNYI